MTSKTVEYYNSLSPSKRKVFDALVNPENWRLSVKKLADKVGVSYSVAWKLVHDDDTQRCLKHVMLHHISGPKISKMLEILVTDAIEKRSLPHIREALQMLGMYDILKDLRVLDAQPDASITYISPISITETADGN